MYSSTGSGRLGRQEPRLRVEPGSPAYSDGEDAAALMAAYAFPLDPWQRAVLGAWCARDARDVPQYLTCGLSCPRQNGKNAALEAYEFYKMAVCGERILHTAHQVRTAAKSFQRLAALFENPAHPEVAEMVANVRRTNGEQGIYLANGGLVEFSARSRGASRGNTYSMLVYDEAQELTDEQVEALMSTVAASPTGYRQIIYTGTPPGPTSPGTVFERVRRAALSGPSAHDCWHEWSVEECPRGARSFADVLDACYETNPALGARLDEAFTETEWRTMGEGGFARERLGWWAEASGNLAFSKRKWDGLAVKASPEGGKVAYGVKFSPDGATAALAACRKPDEGRPFLELVAHESMAAGVTWLAEWLLERRGACALLVVDGRSNVAELAAQLREGGFPRRAVKVCGAADVVESSTRFLNAVREGRVTHSAQPALDAAVHGAVKRPVGHGGGFGWAASGAADVSPLEAASMAYWGVMTTKRDPGRRARIL